MINSDIHFLSANDIVLSFMAGNNYCVCVCVCVCVYTQHTPHFIVPLLLDT
jgi:hypothetical protein